jgi:hypothetical protein
MNERMRRLETWCQLAIYAMESPMFAIHFYASKSAFQYKGENGAQVGKNWSMSIKIISK